VTRALFMTSLWLAGGCGSDHLGVLEVEFALDPAPFSALPSGVDGARVAASHGDVRADAVLGLGRVSVVGLPELPAGLSYSVTVGLLHDEREALPGGESTASEGHAHGALEVAGRRSGPHATSLHDVTLGDLERNLTSGQWLRYFSSEDLLGHPPGGLRACQILLAGIEPLPSALLLAGSVGTVEEVAAHEH